MFQKGQKLQFTPTEAGGQVQETVTVEGYAEHNKDYVWCWTNKGITPIHTKDLRAQVGEPGCPAGGGCVYCN